MTDHMTYRGWSIDCDPKPIPFRGADWTATSPDFDADCDQDGYFCCTGAQVHAATYKELLVEIECAIADAEDDAALKLARGEA